jgi:hypothetical protein
VALRVTEVERVHHHANVRRVFAGLTDVRDLDHLEGGFVQSALKDLVAVEIAVGLFDHNVALEEQTLGHLADVKGGKLGLMRADGDVLQVEEYSHRGVGIGQAHGVGADWRLRRPDSLAAQHLKALTLWGK